MMEEQMMTVGQFNQLVTTWARNVRVAAKGTLESGTHGTGQLAQYLQTYVNPGKDSPEARSIKFHFERYGVFRAYGAGRGYVCINGHLKRGKRVVSESNRYKRQANATASMLSNRGYTKGQIRRMKMASEGEIRRTPLDWIDRHINAKMDTLGGYVMQYYGDMALRNFLGEFKKMRIVKKQ